MTAVCGAAMMAVLPIHAAEEPKKPGPSGAAPMEIPGVHNSFRVTERVYSGSQPEGDEAFEALAKLGVKTIISVDGGKPDLERARKFGMKYVHLPFGYDGIPAERATQLQQAARTIQGPVFMHCHHGKHRGPAAVGIVCETTEGWTPQRAEAWLREAGTAPDYPGLYESVRGFAPAGADKLAKVGPLPETVKTDALVDLMVAIDEQFDAVKALQKGGWKEQTADGASKRTPAQTATLLWEQFRELGRTDDTARRPADYRTKLTEAEQAAESLRKALSASPPDVTAAEAAFKQSTQNRSACHKAFRNQKKQP